MRVQFDVYLRDKNEIRNIEFWTTVDGRGAIAITVDEFDIDFYGMESAEHEHEFAAQMRDAFAQWAKQAKQRALLEVAK